jgi:hypothetical protein
MAQYHVTATFEITVSVAYTIDDEEEIDALDTAHSEAQQLRHRANVKAEEIMGDLTLDMHGCHTWELTGIDCTIEAIEAAD